MKNLIKNDEKRWKLEQKSEEREDSFVEPFMMVEEHEFG